MSMEDETNLMKTVLNKVKNERKTIDQAAKEAVEANPPRKLGLFGLLKLEADLKAKSAAEAAAYEADQARMSKSFSNELPERWDD